MANPGKTSWLGRIEDSLKTFYGPAQVNDAGRPRPRSADRLEGVEGGFDVHRDPSGSTYLVVRPQSQGGTTADIDQTPVAPESKRAPRRPQ